MIQCVSHGTPSMSWHYVIICGHCHWNKLVLLRARWKLLPQCGSHGKSLHTGATSIMAAYLRVCFSYTTASRSRSSLVRLHVSVPQVLSLALWAAVCAYNIRDKAADKMVLGTVGSADPYA